jgi:bacillithiol biosynthesis cysteine-adding enzyme BshC
MHTVPFADLRFSHLFTQFIAENPLLNSHFPSQDASLEHWRSRAASFDGRKELHSAITTTMKDINLSSKQVENLQMLSNPETLAVVTGQQVGFLGGAMYTLLKAYSAVQASNHIADKFSVPIVPIFWIEDNDADSAEAAKTTILSAKNEPLSIACIEEFTTNIPVSEHVFGDGIIGVLDTIESALQPSEFSTELMLHLRTIYQSGKSWSSAFVQLLQLLVAETGILFISAAVARKSGMFSRIVRKEIEEFGEAKREIDHASAQLEEAGFHIQATASEVNLFFHDGNKRLKLRSENNGESYTAGELHFSRDQLLTFTENSPELFSPNVLLRPIVQDDCIPTIAYIGGPGEIAYLAQLSSAYQLFDVPMPMVKPRHSATFMPPSVVRFLEKNNFPTEFFMRPWQQIEKDIIEQTADKSGEPLFRTASSVIEELFVDISLYANGIDQSLVGAVNAAHRYTDKQLEDLQKKINAAQKKRHAALFDKSYETSSIIKPFGELQERILSPIAFVSRFGFQHLIESTRLLLESAPHTHFIAAINFTHINQ